MEYAWNLGDGGELKNVTLPVMKDNWELMKGKKWTDESFMMPRNESRGVCDPIT